MKQRFVRDLAPGENVSTTFLVRRQERKVGRNGSAYLSLELQDSTGVISAKLWDSDHLTLDFSADDIVRVEGEVEDFQGSPQLRVKRIAFCPDGQADLRDYLPRSRRDPEELYARLLARVRAMTGSTGILPVPESPNFIRALLLSVLEDPEIARRYKLAPAATTYHHNYLGGLVEHVTSLVGLADRVCDHYVHLNRDLIVAGLVLHDLGKIEELDFRRGFRYSTRGKLLGHIAIGMDIVRQKMRAIPGFPARLADEIEHIILAHHGQLEWGSPKEPMFPEALVVHYLDDLDSKLESMRAQYEADKDSPGDWTARNRALGRELLKPDHA
ncbi:MAG TPA: HD domain-containing protein [Terriglobia bacterium]|nr:HD domain-containing protein [Terriglobia bacterium]